MNVQTPRNNQQRTHMQTDVMQKVTVLYLRLDEWHMQEGGTYRFQNETSLTDE